MTFLERVHLRLASAVVQSLLLASLALSTAGAGIPDVDWLELSLQAPSIDIPSVSEDRANELADLEAGFTELLWKSSLQIMPDGTLIERFVLIRRFLTTDGIDEGGDLSIFAVPSHESIEIHSARVITSKGEAIDVDPATIQITHNNEPRIFSDVKEIVLPLPGLSIGATSIIEYTSRFNTREWPMPWARHYWLQIGHPIEQLEIEATWQDDKPAWKSSDPDLECTTEGRKLHCVKRQVGALPPDVDLTMAADTMSNFVIGEALSWAELAQHVGRVVDREVEKGVAEGAIESILGSATSEEEKWDALFRFVADEIRYLGLEHGTGAVVPSPPATTLSRRFGDCKDKVTLLITLARSIGIDAYPVLVSTERFDVDAMTLPSSGYFNHMVVCVRTSTGKTRCADPTLNRTKPDETALAIAGKAALPLRADTHEAISIDTPPFGWGIEIESNTEIRCDGSRANRTVRKFTGLAKITLREQYAGVEPSVRERFMLDHYRQTTGSSIAPEIALDGFGKREIPTTISTTSETPASGPLPDQYEFFERDPWLFVYGSSFQSQNSHYPVWSPGAEIRSIHHYSVCKERMARHVGPTLSMKTPFGSLERSYKRHANGVSVESVLRIPSGPRSVDQLEPSNRFLRESLDQTIIWFDLRPSR